MSQAPGGLEPQTKPHLCSYLQGAGGQGSGEGMLCAVSFKTHHGLAMLRRTWPVLAGRMKDLSLSL